MRMILIGNYPLDKQESMLRFANMLSNGFNTKGVSTEIWEPVVFFGARFKSTTTGLGKWFGYIDKWLLFPFLIRLRMRKVRAENMNIRFHICDHSNAPYLKYLPKNRTGITCHDVLAIRGALGFTDAHCPATPLGTILQKWILKNLGRANTLAAVSHFTLNQLEALSPNTHMNKNWKVIHNAFNAPFKPMESAESIVLLRQMGLNETEPFLLHVGSALARKNRKLLLKLVDHLGEKWEGKICFAGKPMDNDLLALAKGLNLTDRVVSVVKPVHQQLVALYSACEAFIFPSLSEGFGWPVIEAQACGAPVIASNLEPMPEVSGNMAIHIHPDDASGFADAVLSLKNQSTRESIINSGYQNIERFHTTKMIDAYLSMHQVTHEKIGS